MLRLLEALTEPPAADTVAVRTAAAAVEELCVLEVYSWGNKGNGDSSGNIIGGGEAVRARTHASVVGDPALQALPRGGLWGPGTRNQRFAAMLTDAYARSAGMCLPRTVVGYDSLGAYVHEFQSRFPLQPSGNDQTTGSHRIELGTMP